MVSFKGLRGSEESVSIGMGETMTHWVEGAHKRMLSAGSASLLSPKDIRSSIWVDMTTTMLIPRR